MKHYLINDYIDNCPKITFYELLSEAEYRFYMQVKLKLHKLDVHLGEFLTYNVLQFEPKEISDIEYSILDKYEPKGSYYPTSELTEYLLNKAEEVGVELPARISEITDEQLMEVINAITKRV